MRRLHAIPTLTPNPNTTPTSDPLTSYLEDWEESEGHAAPETLARDRYSPQPHQSAPQVTYIWELYYDELRWGQWVGSTVSITVNNPGKYTLHLRAVLADKTVVATSNETVYVKVRGLRGFRSGV